MVCRTALYAELLFDKASENVGNLNAEFVGVQQTKFLFSCLCQAFPGDFFWEWWFNDFGFRIGPKKICNNRQQSNVAKMITNQRKGVPVSGGRMSSISSGAFEAACASKQPDHCRLSRFSLRMKNDRSTGK